MEDQSYQIAGQGSSQLVGLDGAGNVIDVEQLTDDPNEVMTQLAVLTDGGLLVRGARLYRFRRATRAPTLHYLLGRIHERRSQHREAAVQYRNVIKQTNLVQQSYLCLACDGTVAEWVDRCPACGEWNSIVEEIADSAPIGGKAGKGGKGGGNGRRLALSG